VIPLDDSTYNYYATTKPCPYHLVVFLTATHPKFRCNICKQLDKEFQLLASSYYDSHITSSSNKENDADIPVFFIRLDYESSQRVFQSYQMTSVPVVFYLPPRINNEVNDFVIGVRDTYQVPADPDAEGLASFLRDKTSISVNIKRSMIGVYFTILIAFGILLALIRPVMSALPFLLKIVRFRPIWLTVSAGVYTCAISGLIFDIIRSPQMYYANPQTGQIMFFYPQSGNQFVVEGFIIGFLNLGCAGALIFLAAVSPTFKSQKLKDYSLIGCVVIFTICFMQIRSLYIMKNRWYGSVM